MAAGQAKERAACCCWNQTSKRQPLTISNNASFCRWTKWQKAPNPTTIPQLLANPSLCAGVSSARPGRPPASRSNS